MREQLKKYPCIWIFLSEQEKRQEKVESLSENFCQGKVLNTMILYIL